MSKNTGTSELINYFDLGANGDVGIAGSLDVNTIANATTDTDRFLVSDTGIIKYRTGAELLSDIGAAPAVAGGYVPYTGATTNVDLGIYNITAHTIRATGSANNAGQINLRSDAIFSLVNGYGTIGSGTTNQFNFYQTTGAGVFRGAIFSLNSITASATRTFTLPDADGTIALTSSLSGYLPLTGGTLTGALNGTSATFSGTGYFGGATTASGLTGASELIVQNEIGIQNSDTTGPYLRMVMGGLNQNITFVTGAFSGTEPNLLFSVGGATRLTLASTGAATFNLGSGEMRLNRTGTSEYLKLNTYYLLTDGNDQLLGSVTGATNIYAGNGVSPRLTITSGGNVLIGTTTDSGIRFFVQAANTNWTSIYDNTASGANGLLIRLVGGSQGFYYGAYDGGAYKFYINGSGVVHSTSTSIVAISDISLKTNIRDLDKGLKDILQLKPRKFDWKNGDGIDNLGFIAQEIEKVFPELVSEFKYNQFETKKALKMGDLIPSLVKAIQELKQEIDTLKK